MKFLLVYKGSFGAALRSPEMRYAALAAELLKLGHEVVLCARAGDGCGIPEGVKFVAVADLRRLTRAFLRADVIVLHGGGPVVLALAMLCGVLGRRIVLDAYVPHWIELDELIRSGVGSPAPRLLAKAQFNVLRALLGTLAFNLNIVANQRQMDLLRGIMAPFSLTRDFSRVVVIPFGCERSQARSREAGRARLGRLAGGEFADDDFLIGWLGGTYGWFDLDGVLAEVSRAICKDARIKLCFFGVDEERRPQLLAPVAPEARGNLFFLPWIDFATRLEHWAGFDVSLVWGGQNYENDYASRTRNFDCLSIGLPVVQNEDHEWGPRLKASGAGVVVAPSALTDTLLQLANSPEVVTDMREAMHALAQQFHWQRFASALVDAVDGAPMSPMRRLVGLLAFCAALPAALMLFALALVESLVGKSRT